MNKYFYLVLFSCLLISCEKSELATEGANSRKKEKFSGENKIRENSVTRKIERRRIVHDKSVKIREKALKNYLHKLRNRTSTIADLNIVWAAHWPLTYDEQLPSVSYKNDVKNGKVLPDEFFSMLQSLKKTSLFEQIREKECSLVNNTIELECLKVLYALYSGSVYEGQATALSIALLKSSKKLPPSKGDPIVASMAVESIKLADKIGPISDDDLNDWKMLAKAPNPLYRYLAIQSSNLFRLNDDQKYEIYKMYMKETDEYIVEIVASKMNDSQSEKIINLKRSLYVRYASEKNTKMMKLFALD